MVNVAVSQGHVGLVLLQNNDSSFYLQIPLDIINALCLRPRKYLRFLGWCILGVEGQVIEDAGDAEIGDDGDLTNQMVYRYVPDEEPDPASIVDLEVIKARTNVPSETTQTRDDFRTRLLERDACCVWTGVGSNNGVGLHIIPFKRGSEWLQLIVHNRPSNGENVATLNDINDIRNGIFASTLVHPSFDQRLAVVLKTPNPILEKADVPEHTDRELRADVVYPQRRYSLQWLTADDPMILRMCPNNSDATFRRGTTKQKPSDLLLHYNYGAAAVKIWGHNKTVLETLAEPPRPRVPAPVQAGPSRTVHDRLVAIGKRDAAQTGAMAGGGNGGRGRGAMVASESQAKWNEDDVMIFCWGNTKAARERHLRKANEDARRIEQWRGGIPQDSA